MTTTKTAIAEFENALKHYNVACTICDAAERIYESELENEVAESAFDAAYRLMHERFNELANVLVSICAPHVDGFTEKTARVMIMNSADQMNALVARFAA